jgi:hypothetical protein
MFVVSLSRPNRRSFRHVRQPDGSLERVRPNPAATLMLSYIGPHLECARLAELQALLEDSFGTNLEPHYYPSRNFDRFATEGQGTHLDPSAEELAAAHLLADKTTRTLAIAIKSTGGLLVKDIAAQLPQDERHKAESIRVALQSGSLIESDIVVVCTKNQMQTARAPSREILEELDKKGVRCACGRSIASERIEEALTISPLGKTLLDGSRWLTILLVEELLAVGVPSNKIIVEQHSGGDELDCLANISGELALFELKDKEFSLGNAYSFGAKIGIVKPNHPVIVSTERVGNDAKEHFQRAGLSRGKVLEVDEEFDEDSEQEHHPELRYVEGLEEFRKGVQNLASEIYLGDATRILAGVLRLASLEANAIAQGLAQRVIVSSTKTEPAVDGAANPLAEAESLPS